MVRCFGGQLSRSPRLCSCLVPFKGPPPLAMAALVAVGLGFGALISLFSMLGQRKLARQGIDTGDMGPIQERQVTVNASPTEAFVLCKRALLTAPKIEIEQEDASTGEIRATTGMTLRSFGENLTVRITRLTDDSSQIIVRSEPSLKTTKLDYGKAVENVETFLRNLNRTIESV